MSDQIRKAAVLFAESAAERVRNCSVAGKGLSGRKAPPIPASILRTRPHRFVRVLNLLHERSQADQE